MPDSEVDTGTPSSLELWQVSVETEMRKRAEASGVLRTKKASKVSEVQSIPQTDQPSPRYSEDVLGALALHNTARASASFLTRNRCEPLIWSTDLELGAQRWAEQLAWKEDERKGRRKLAHSSLKDRQKHGENLYMRQLSMGRNIDFRSAVEFWVNEKKFYKGQEIKRPRHERYNGREIRNKTEERYKNYTQIIWPSTTAVGMGKAESASGTVFVVARYYQRGNLPGMSPYGVTFSLSGGETTDKKAVLKKAEALEERERLYD